MIQKRKQSVCIFFLYILFGDISIGGSDPFVAVCVFRSKQIYITYQIIFESLNLLYKQFTTTRKQDRGKNKHNYDFVIEKNPVHSLDAT